MRRKEKIGSRGQGGGRMLWRKEEGRTEETKLKRKKRGQKNKRREQKKWRTLKKEDRR